MRAEQISSSASIKVSARNRLQLDLAALTRHGFSLRAVMGGPLMRHLADAAVGQNCCPRAAGATAGRHTCRQQRW
eukprot:5272659-Prymnesium_polylepis.5